MQFEYLTIADAVNNGPEGKINALGMGARIANFESLPAQAAMTVLFAVSATVDEAGQYEVDVAIRAPDGSREMIAHGPAELIREVADARVPTGLTFAVPSIRSFGTEGVHSIEVRVGELTRSYDFLVRIHDAAAPVASTPPRATASRRRVRVSQRDAVA